MARKCFIGFDYDFNGESTGLYSGWNAALFAFPSGVNVVSQTSDTIFFEPQSPSASIYTISGRNAGSNAFGVGVSTIGILDNTSYGCPSIVVSRISLGNPQEIYTSFDIKLEVAANTSISATNMRSQARYQVFKWGDLSLRMRRIYGYTSSPFTQLSYEFEAFNNTSSLGTLPIVNLTSTTWAFVKIRARLDSGSSGRFDVNIDGVTLNTSNIDSVQSTTLNDATQIYFSGGHLGPATGSSQPIYVGAIDNILIDDAEFATGRPIGRRISYVSDNTLTNWVPNGNTTITNALTGSGTARGTGTGSTALLNLGAVNTASLQSDILGFQIIAARFSNLDPLLSARLRTGISLFGTASNGTEISAFVPPMTPSIQTPIRSMDTIFYKSGSTSNFKVSELNDCKIRLEVTS